METSVPFNTNAFQQGAAGNQHVETTAANNAPPLSPQEMRQKVVEILSSTANGCLQELGCYPGMSTRLQELETRNQNWQKENMKLYEDNKRLQQIVRMQAENLSSLTAQDAEKNKRIAQLELENRFLRAQLQQLTKAKANDNSGQEQMFGSLYKDHVALIDTYNRAYHEILRLRQLLKSGEASAQLQQNQDQNAFQHLLSSQVSNSMNSRRPLQLQTQVPGGRVGPIPNQQQSVASPTIVSPVNPQFLMQQEQYQSQLKNDHYNIRPHVPQPPTSVQILCQPNSLNMNTMNMIRSLPNMQQQMPFQNSRPVSIHRPTPSTYHNAASLPPTAGTMQNVQNFRHGSHPVTSTDHHLIAHNSQQSLFWPPQSQVGRRSIRTGSAPLPNQPHHIDLPPPPASAPPGAMSLTKSFATAPSVREQYALSTLPETSQQPSMSTRLSPNDAYIPPLGNTLAAPVPILPQSAHVSLRIAGISLSTSSPSTMADTRPLPSADEVVESTAAQSGPPDVVTLNNVSRPYSASSPGLKREVSSFEKSDVDVVNGSNKKPRLGSSDMDTSSSSAGAAAPSIVTEATEISIVPVISTPTDDSMEQALDADEEDEEEIVEVGPDGLRLVEDILEQVYGQNRRGEVVCWFCKYRFEKGVTTLPPTVFNSASDQELEAHCVANHETAWNQARASV